MKQHERCELKKSSKSNLKAIKVHKILLFFHQLPPFLAYESAVNEIIMISYFSTPLN